MTEHRARSNPSNRTRDPGGSPRRRRNQLLDAALRAISRCTCWVTSMESIAAEGGVSKPVVYKHFGDREQGLAIEVARRFAAGLEVDMAAALEAETDPPPTAPRCAWRPTSPTSRPTPRCTASSMPSSWAAPRTQGQSSSGLIPRIVDQMAVVIADGLRTSGRDDAAAEAWAYGAHRTHPLHRGCGGSTTGCCRGRCSLCTSPTCSCTASPCCRVLPTSRRRPCRQCAPEGSGPGAGHVARL